MSASPAEGVPVAHQIRLAAGLTLSEGPDDEVIDGAVAAFVGQFEYWFTRVLVQAVPKYRMLIVRRVNPLIRPIEFEGLDSEHAARRLVSDYVNRNFVTAGGWAIEKMAIALAAAVGGQKASSRGIDLERADADGSRHLYVIKSGTVTRNSDILSKLKQHARDAERLIRQGGAKKVGVFANYVVATGATSSSFEDGIHRPSSGEFWGEITGLDVERSLALVREIARTAGAQVSRNTDSHIGALVALVRAYISQRDEPNAVDWPFLFKVTMTEKREWAEEDQARHVDALRVLAETGYELASARRGRSTARKTVNLARRGKAARGGSE